MSYEKADDRICARDRPASAKLYWFKSNMQHAGSRSSIYSLQKKTLRVQYKNNFHVKRVRVP